MTRANSSTVNCTETCVGDPPAWLVLFSVVKLLAAGVVFVVGGVVGLAVCAAIAIAYVVLAIIFVTLVSVAFTPACGFVALLLAIWFPISLFTAD